MSDDEDDYMSDKFLTGINDVRPSLIQDRGKKRSIVVAEKKDELIRKQKETRRERTGENRNEKLQESLKKPLESDNKGFQMLAKMGYKAGQALGRSQQAEGSSEKDKRLIEPIGINIKNDRGGLGREAALQELNEKRKALRLKHLKEKAGLKEVLTTEEYRKRATQKAEERYTLGALRKCQMSCETLDTKAGLKDPEMIWFWPERPKLVPEDESKHSCDSEEDEAEEEEEFSPSEKLEMLISYLRTSYIFCFWCGVQYQDQQDLDTNCPGLTRDDH